MSRPSAPAHRPGRGRRSCRCGDPPPPRLRQGIEEFNRGQFFQQHETLEFEWIEEPDPVRYLSRGTLRVGVGFEHLGHGKAGAGGLERFDRALIPRVEWLTGSG
jgi:hypothetical protein